MAPNDRKIFLRIFVNGATTFSLTCDSVHHYTVCHLLHCDAECYYAQYRILNDVSPLCNTIANYCTYFTIGRIHKIGGTYQPSVS